MLRRTGGLSAIRPIAHTYRSIIVSVREMMSWPAKFLIFNDLASEVTAEELPSFKISEGHPVLGGVF